jgi:hypothetical protein
MRKKYTNPFTALADSKRAKKLLIKRAEEKTTQPLRRGESELYRDVDLETIGDKWFNPPKSNWFDQPKNNWGDLIDKFHTDIYKDFIVDNKFLQRPRRSGYDYIAWQQRNISAGRDSLNIKRPIKIHHKILSHKWSIEFDLLCAIRDKKRIRTKTTEYNPKSGTLNLYGVTIANLTADHQVKNVCMPILEDTKIINLFRLRLRQLGLNCYSYKHRTYLEFWDGTKLMVEPGKLTDIPANFRRSCLPKAMVNKFVAPFINTKLSGTQLSLPLLYTDVVFQGHKLEELKWYHIKEYNLTYGKYTTQLSYGTYIHNGTITLRIKLKDVYGKSIKDMAIALTDTELIYKRGNFDQLIDYHSDQLVQSYRDEVSKSMQRFSNGPTQSGTLYNSIINPFTSGTTTTTTQNYNMQGLYNFISTI